MENINVEKIYDVINFLKDNEQYGDDWSDEIAELRKVIDAIEVLMKQSFKQGGLYIRLFFCIFNYVDYMQYRDSQWNNRRCIVIYCCRKEMEERNRHGYACYHYLEESCS